MLGGKRGAFRSILFPRDEPRAEGARIEASPAFPDGVLREAMEHVQRHLASVRKLRRVANLHAHRFASDAWVGFFRRLQRDFTGAYLETIEDHLRELRFRDGEFLSAGLGRANKGEAYRLHRVPPRGWDFWEWWSELIGDAPEAFRFELHPRDEAGARALGEIRARGIAIAADTLGQAAEHIRDFFGMLRAELALYVGCLNLHEDLARKGLPTCLPETFAVDEVRLCARGLYDVGLALGDGGQIVGNDLDADRRDLLIVTGPNSGGRSTFLRSLGAAQLMAQAGIFVPASMLGVSLRTGVFTHFKREEDAGLTSGKFDEELDRMSAIVDCIRPGALLLLNESFAATNEREGSEIAQGIIGALLERGVRIACVTHMYELAHGFMQRCAGTLFLRAGRGDAGERTFRVGEGAPLETSFGVDIYQRVFGEAVAVANVTTIRPKDLTKFGEETRT